MIIPKTEPIAATAATPPPARTRAPAPSIIAPATRPNDRSLADAWKPKPQKP